MLGEGFRLDELASRAKRLRTSYFEFFRVPALSVGLYLLPKGGLDLQTPHEQNELYYVRKGRAELEIGGRRIPVEQGNLLFVPARAEHRFVDIAEPLELLVVFGPAEAGS